MGNTCGTCAFDNRGTEVDMKQTKGIKKQGEGVGATNQYADYHQQEQYAQKVDLNDTVQFLEPPNYQCDAVMSFRRNNPKFEYNYDPNEDGQQRERRELREINRAPGTAADGCEKYQGEWIAGTETRDGRGF